jgi:hypothetical protein
MYNFPQTPQSTTTGPPVSRQSFSSNVSPAAGSPSALFGGVDQLLRESSDWWLRDQSQLAVGFEHWPMAEGEWLGAATSPVAPSHSSLGGNGISNGINGIGTNGIGNGAYNAANEGNGFGVDIGRYNENDWYS